MECGPVVLQISADFERHTDSTSRISKFLPQSHSTRCKSKHSPLPSHSVWGVILSPEWLLSVRAQRSFAAFALTPSLPSLAISGKHLSGLTAQPQPHTPGRTKEAITWRRVVEVAGQTEASVKASLFMYTNTHSTGRL